MESFSTQYISVAVIVLAKLAEWAGLQIGSAEITTTVVTVIQLLAGAKILWERYHKGGITWFGGKI